MFKHATGWGIWKVWPFDISELSRKLSPYCGREHFTNQKADLFLITGYIWRCTCRAWRCTIYRLYLEKRFCLFWVRQEPLLQAVDYVVRSLYRSVLGLRLCNDGIWSDLVYDALHAWLQHLYRLLSESEWKSHQLLSCTNLWSLWLLFEEHYNY